MTTIPETATAGLVGCRFCGAALLERRRGRRRKFCSDRCRFAAHAAARRPGPRPVAGASLPGADGLTWAAKVRETYELSVGESALVDLAAAALQLGLDATQPGPLRLQSIRQFAALLKLLDLPAPPEDDHGEAQTARPPRPVLAVRR
jgi:hypothetical protein